MSNASAPKAAGRPVRQSCVLTASALLAAGLAAAAASAPAGAAERIGVTAAVNPAAQGTPPDAGTRVLYVGIDMQADERVTTSADGRAQLLFLDGSAMSVGPDSDVTLDRFVYDPDTDSGALAATVGRGVLRFVGGRISKQDAVRIDAGAATIGIRGGIATIAVGAGGDVRSSFLFGERMTVTSEGVSRSTDMPGTAIDILAGQPPQPPRILTRAEVTATLSAFNGRPAAPQEAGQAPAPAGAGPAAGSPDRLALADLATQAEVEGAELADQTGRTEAAAEEVPRASGPTSADEGPDPDARLAGSGLAARSSAQDPGSVQPVTPDTRQAGAAQPRAAGPAGGGTAESRGAQTVAGAGAEQRSGGIADAIAERDRGAGGANPPGDPGAGGGGEPMPPQPQPQPQPQPPVAQASQGRLLRDPAFDSFDPQSLAVRFLGENTPLLREVRVAEGRLRAVTETGEALDFPYRITGSDYAVTAAEATGPFASFAARMYVAADGSFWRIAGTAPGQAGDPDQREFVVFGGTPTGLSQIPTAGTVALAVGGLPEPLPFLGGSTPLDAQGPGIAISPFYLRYGPGIGFAQRQSGAAPPVGYLAALAVTGQGAAQRSFMAGATATIVEEGPPGSGSPALSGRMRGSYQQSSGEPPLALRASLASIGVGAGSAIYGKTGSYALLDPATLEMNPQTGEVTRQTAGMLVRRPDGLIAGSDEYFVLGAQPGAATPPDFPGARSSRSLQGFSSGLVYRRDGPAVDAGLFIDAGGGEGGLTIQTDSATGSVAAGLLLVKIPSQAAEAEDAADLVRFLPFGDHGAALAAQPASAMIDDDRYIALEAPDAAAFAGNGEATVGKDLVLVTAASVDPGALALGAQTCRCEYLDWGFWSGTLALGEDSEERYHMASWVAGELPDLAAIPASGTASYAGHIVGSVINQGAAYLAAGRMTTNWDFAQRAGAFHVEGFDSADYAGQIFSGNGRAIVGAGQTADQGRVMAVNGSFFSGGGDPAAAMGGHFIAQDQAQSYAAGGTWALDRQ